MGLGCQVENRVRRGLLNDPGHARRVGDVRLDQFQPAT